MASDHRLVIKSLSTQVIWKEFSRLKKSISSTFQLLQSLMRRRNGWSKASFAEIPAQTQRETKDLVRVGEDFVGVLEDFWSIFGGFLEGFMVLFRVLGRLCDLHMANYPFFLCWSKA